MKGPRLFDHPDSGLDEQKRRSTRFQLFRCPVFAENIGGEQKKVFVVRDEAPRFLRGARLQPA